MSQGHVLKKKIYGKLIEIFKTIFRMPSYWITGESKFNGDEDLPSETQILQVYKT